MLPLIGDIAPPTHRATAISLVSSGLLLGLLIARVLAGIVSEYTSWRNIYWLALGLQISITIALWGFMPDYPATLNSTAASASCSVSAPTSKASTSIQESRTQTPLRDKLLIYPSILWSIITLFTNNKTLIQASLMGFCFSVPYTSFWTTLTFLLSAEPYSYSTLVIGLFAVVGILPMALGPVYSRLVLDRSVPLVSALVGVGFCFVGALVGIVGGSGSGSGSIAGPIVQCVLLDLGQQVALTACRVAIYESAPGARSRVNTAFVLFLFGGNILGTSLGPLLFVRFGWVVTEGVAGGFAALAIVLGVFRGPREGGWVGWGGGWGWRRMPVVKEAEIEGCSGRVQGQVGVAGVLVQSGEGEGEDRSQVHVHDRETHSRAGDC
jgi:predicted MFS family arabinose efflux permease